MKYKINIKNLLPVDKEHDEKVRFLLKFHKHTFLTPTNIYYLFESPDVKNKYKGSTRIRLRSALKKVVLFTLKHCGRKKEIPMWSSACSDIKIKRYHGSHITEDDIITKEDFQSALTYMATNGLMQTAIIAILLFELGVRPGELLRIKLSDCIKSKSIKKNEIFEYYKISIHATKTNLNYFVFCRTELFELANSFFKGKIYLIESLRTRKPFKDVDSIGKGFRKVSKFLGKPFYPYLLRHSYANNHYVKTKDARAGAKLMGHSIEMHLTAYVHTNIDVFKTLKVTKTNSTKILKGYMNV